MCAGMTLLLTMLGISSAWAEPLRIGVLRFGTVNWELDVMQHHGFLKKYGVTIEVVGLGSKNATNVAIQGGAADIIVNDWLWVSRQRTDGRKYTFVPYSYALGALMVRPDSNINSLADLKGNKLGIAGGPIDKSWLLLRAHTAREYDSPVDEWVEPQFGAPPLLNQLVKQDRLPAVLTFWHFAARLKAAGMRTLFDVESLFPQLGLETAPPLLGWVFDSGWAADHAVDLEGFLNASYEAKKLLAQSDAEWERIRPLTKAQDDATLFALRDAYRAGIPRKFTAKEKEAAQALMKILGEAGGEKLVGKNPTLAPGTFWTGYDVNAFWQ